MTRKRYTGGHAPPTPSKKKRTRNYKPLALPHPPEVMQRIFDELEARCALMAPVTPKEVKARASHLAKERRQRKKAEQTEELKALLDLATTTSSDSTEQK